MLTPTKGISENIEEWEVRSEEQWMNYLITGHFNQPWYVGFKQAQQPSREADTAP